jgi:hypothetical protein
MKRVTLNVEYHFVVTYNTETERFELDYNAQTTRLKDGPVWDADRQEWRPLQDWEWERDGTAYNNAADGLFTLVSELNRARKNFEVPSLQ